jgi:hypothetical protein
MVVDLFPCDLLLAAVLAQQFRHVYVTSHHCPM